MKKYYRNDEGNFIFKKAWFELNQGVHIFPYNTKYFDEVDIVLEKMSEYNFDRVELALYGARKITLSYHEISKKLGISIDKSGEVIFFIPEEKELINDPEVLLEYFIGQSQLRWEEQNQNCIDSNINHITI